MNKTELVKQVAKNCGYTQKDVAAVVDMVFSTISATVVGGEKVIIPGFGSFDTTERAGRTGINPRTGEPLEIGPTRNMKFKPSTTIKKAYK